MATDGPSEQGNGIERWRGKIDERVDYAIKRLDALDNDIKAVYRELDGIRVNSTEIRLEVRETRGDVSEAVESFKEMRAKDWDRLEHNLFDAISDHTTTRRDLFRFLVAPIIVAVIMILIVAVLTGNVTVH